MYVGWDIGIKNLAYCLIKKLDTDTPPSPDTKNVLHLGNNYYQISDWDVINIVPQVSEYIHQRGEVMLQQRPIVKCRAEISNKGKNKGKPKLDHYCGKTALICLDENPEYDPLMPAHKHGYFGYCGTHKKQADLTNKKYLDTKLTNSYCSVIITDTNMTGDKIDNTSSKLVFKRCGTKSVYIDSKHYFRGICKKHHNQVIKDGTSSDGDYLKIIRGKKSTQLDITQLSTALYDELAKRPHLHQNSTCVLLENQPVLTNPTMKSVQVFVHAYFMDYGMRNNLGSVKEIHCYSASKKLDLIKYVSQSVYEAIKTEVKTIPKKYGRHKRIAIRLCENFLGPDSSIGQNCSEIYNQFKLSKKKDDLADSLLMTLHYLERDALKNMRSDNILKPILCDTVIMSENEPLVDSATDEDDDGDNNDDATISII